MALNYTTYVATIAELTANAASNPNFQQILPSAIDYAEGRIYREGDFLNMELTDTGTVTANQRNFVLPSTFGKFLVVDQINIFTPVGTATTRNPVIPASLETINAFWPSNAAPSATTVPTLFAVNHQSQTGDTTVTFGPSPGAGFTAEVIGSVQPTALSESNPTTFLSTFLPDLLIAASMVFMTGWMKNFGAQSDDPKQAISWESQYRTLMESAQLVEARKTFQSQGWTSKQPAPLAASAR